MPASGCRSCHRGDGLRSKYDDHLINGSFVPYMMSSNVKVDRQHGAPGAAPNTAGVGGAVSGWNGTCPSLTLTMDATAVKTSVPREADQKRHSAIANGVKRSDGSIQATQGLVDKGVK